MLTFENSQTFPLLGIFIGQKPPHTEAAWNLTILCLEIVGLSIGEPMLGITVIQRNLASAKDITV